ncbi:hypothetical protein [Pseudochrobactrum asaccharolyticum]|uniref:hypothetical protein n=1 Tax=Pseudochrobactrum asaccharolyticum TaxID=354351 RepID=UPI00404325CD
MQKSAHISSIATRLNNLEQKFDDFEEPSGGGGSETDIERIVRNTFATATDGRSGKWQENSYFFDGRTDMSAMLWGPYFWYPETYESCATVPFYHQVFGQGYRDKFGHTTTSTLAGAVFGSSTADDYVDSFATHGKCLAKSVFGSREGIEQIENALPFSGSLYAQCFGGDPAQVPEKFEEVGKSISEYGSSEKNLLDALVKLSADVKLALDDIEDSLESINGRLNSLSARVSALE